MLKAGVPKAETPVNGSPRLANSETVAMQGKRGQDADQASQ